MCTDESQESIMYLICSILAALAAICIVVPTEIRPVHLIAGCVISIGALVLAIWHYGKRQQAREDALTNELLGTAPHPDQ